MDPKSSSPNKHSTEKWPKCFSCSFGAAGFSCEIESFEEITYSWMGEGLFECLYHEYETELGAEEVLEECKIHKSDYPDQGTYEAALLAGIKPIVARELCPIPLECDINGEPFQVEEKVRRELENDYIDFVSERLLDEIFWLEKE